MIQISKQTEVELSELHQINRNILLESGNLHQTRVCALRLQMQQQKLEVYRNELTYLTNSNTPKLTAQLVITEQPLPQVVFLKEKQLKINI